MIDDKHNRVLHVFLLLLSGKKVTKIELSQNCSVEIRTIQRYFATIRELITQYSLPMTLHYNSATKQYSFVNQQILPPKELLAISKILLESRAFNSNEMNQIMTHLLKHLTTEEHRQVRDLIANELLYYCPLSHEKNLLEDIWTFSDYIRKQTVINYSYKNRYNQLLTRTALPVSLYFSEYYFYVICYQPEKEIYLINRLDRFVEIKPTSKKIKIPHKDRFEDGKFRQKAHFMYAGKDRSFSFRFWGIPEAALDKLPKAKIKEQLEDRSVIIEAEAYDNGLIMWLLSQGDQVQVLSPASLVTMMKEKISKMGTLYSNEAR